MTSAPSPKTPAAVAVLTALAAVLALSSCAALLTMLLLKAAHMSPVWPGFTQYAYVAFPGAFLALVAAVVVALAHRR